ncbi:metalloprotease, variant 2 [Entomophthora muscae]|uniref:Metalloprotease, variant 2 n=1 Tax=Entomophthora muscae TaxID=34485 RepID=A0ACC2SYD9_9FUNG|nr:metalloprotease, variant 2 [Entomophthora muscae]
MFSDAFVKPGFTLKTTVNEAYVINLEFKLKAKNPNFIIEKVAASVPNKESVYARFRIGNEKTLSVDSEESQRTLLDKAKQHYATYYSANLMHLVVISPEPLDKLREMVVARFSKIHNRNLEATNTGVPFDLKQFPKEIRIKGDEEQLILQFLLPGKQRISNEAIEYLFYYLKDHYLRYFRETGIDWTIYSVKVVLDESNLAFSLLNVYILPAQNQPGPAITDFFSYLRAFKKEALDPKRYTSFISYQRNGEILDRELLSYKLAQMIGSKMSSGIPMDKIVNSLHPQYFPQEEIKQLIDMFSVDKMRIINVTSKGKFGLYEPWHGTEYAVVEFQSPATLKTTEIHLPPVVHTKPVKKGINLPTNITQLVSSDHMKVWHLKGPTSQLSRLKLALYDMTSEPNNTENIFLKLLAHHISDNWDLNRTEFSLRNEVLSLQSESNKLTLHLCGTNLVNTLAEILKTASTAINSTRSLERELEFNQESVTKFINWFKSFINCHQIDLLVMGEEDIHSILFTLQMFQKGLRDCERTLQPKLQAGPIQASMFTSKHTKDGFELDYFIPFPTKSLRHKALSFLLYNFAEVDFFNTLRAQNHLAYALDAKLNRDKFGINFHMAGVEQIFITQSAIDNFVLALKDKLISMPNDTYARKKHDIIRAMVNRRPELMELFDLYWQNIMNNDYDFAQGNLT